MISCKTKIGFGSPNKSGKASSHGSPLGLDEINLVRKKLQWRHKPFEIQKIYLKNGEKLEKEGIGLEKKWNKAFLKSKNKVDKLFNQNFSKELKLEKIKSTKN